MPRIDHAALWVSDLAGARDFYVGWFAGRSNGEYHNPATGLRTFIITFEPDDAGEASNGRSARLELMSRPDIAASTGAGVHNGGEGFSAKGHAGVLCGALRTVSFAIVAGFAAFLARNGVIDDAHPLG